MATPEPGRRRSPAIVAVPRSAPAGALTATVGATQSAAAANVFARLTVVAVYVAPDSAAPRREHAEAQEDGQAPAWPHRRTHSAGVAGAACGAPARVARRGPRLADHPDEDRERDEQRRAADHQHAQVAVCERDEDVADVRDGEGGARLARVGQLEARIDGRVGVALGAKDALAVGAAADGRDAVRDERRRAGAGGRRVGDDVADARSAVATVLA